MALLIIITKRYITFTKLKISFMRVYDLFKRIANSEFCKRDDCVIKI